jgi:hypothetical protein
MTSKTTIRIWHLTAALAVLGLAYGFIMESSAQRVPLLPVASAALARSVPTTGPYRQTAVRVEPLASTVTPSAALAAVPRRRPATQPVITHRVINSSGLTRHVEITRRDDLPLLILRCEQQGLYWAEYFMDGQSTITIPLRRNTKFVAKAYRLADPIDPDKYVWKVEE